MVLLSLAEPTALGHFQYRWICMVCIWLSTKWSAKAKDTKGVCNEQTKGMYTHTHSHHDVERFSQMISGHNDDQNSPNANAHVTYSNSGPLLTFSIVVLMDCTTYMWFGQDSWFRVSLSSQCASISRTNNLDAKADTSRPVAIVLAPGGEGGNHEFRYFQVLCSVKTWSYGIHGLSH